MRVMQNILVTTNNLSKHGFHGMKIYLLVSHKMRVACLFAKLWNLMDLSQLNSIARMRII